MVYGREEDALMLAEPEQRSLENEERSLAIAAQQSYLSTLARNRVGRRLRSRIDPPDLVQQTLLRAYQGRAWFRGAEQAELRSWLRAIMANLITDAIRRAGGRGGKQRERSLDDEAGSAAGFAVLMADNLSSPSQKARRGEAAIGLAEAIARLPEEQRTAVRLHHLDELPVAEVAARMNRSVASVAGLIRRGLDGLRNDQRLAL